MKTLLIIMIVMLMGCNSGSKSDPRFTWKQGSFPGDEVYASVEGFDPQGCLEGGQIEQNDGPLAGTWNADVTDYNNFQDGAYQYMRIAEAVSKEEAKKAVENWANSHNRKCKPLFTYQGDHP